MRDFNSNGSKAPATFSLLVPYSESVNGKSLMLESATFKKSSFENFNFSYQNDVLKRQLNGIVPDPFDWRLYNPQRN